VTRELPPGVTVRYYHHRRYRTSADGLVVEPTGGWTHAVILDAEHNAVATGVADCHRRENYCKRLGRTIALGRALKALDDERAAKS
jgi:hypothetical protein